MIDIDSIYMGMALNLAREAAEDGEVPVGAVIVREGRVLGKGRNRVETLGDPTAHAEMEAITAAANTLGDKRLEGASLYVTLEPCPMCAGALVLARLERVVFGATDPKAGACGTLFSIHDDPRLNHRLLTSGGVMAEEASALLSDFFRRLREKKRLQKAGGANGHGPDGDEGR